MRTKDEQCDQQMADEVRAKDEQCEQPMAHEVRAKDEQCDEQMAHDGEEQIGVGTIFRHSGRVRETTATASWDPYL